MRPRVFPAEDDRLHVPDGLRGVASMRPRVFPAEDWPNAASPYRRSRFNEAAGIPRGRRLDGPEGTVGEVVLQ